MHFIYQHLSTASVLELDVNNHTI